MAGRPHAGRSRGGMAYVRNPAVSVVLAALLAAGVVFGLGRYVDGVENARYQARQRVLAEEAVRTLASRMQQSLYSRLFLAAGLKGFVSHSPEFTREEFERFCLGLWPDDAGVRALELAPGTVIDYIYPPHGNRAALGLDLAHRPEQRAAVHRSITERTFMVSGPFTLVQGGEGVVGQYPVFLPTGPDRTERFWGFAIVVIDFPRLLVDAGWEQAPGYRLVLSGGDGARGTLWGDPWVLHEQPVTAEIAFPNGHWHLAGVPQEGWSPTRTDAGLFRLAWLALVLLSGVGGGTVAWLLFARRQHARRLAESEGNLQRAFQVAPFPLLVGRLADGKVLKWNRAAAQLFGDGGRSDELFARVLTTGLGRDGAVEGLSVVLPGSDGGGCRLSMSARAIVYHGEAAVIAGFLDVTEGERALDLMRAAKEQAEQAMRSKSEFLAVMSHEIRTPLHGLLGATQLLERSRLAPDQGRWLDTIRDSGQLLLKLLDDVLDFSKLEAGEVAIEPGDVPLRALLGEVIALVSPAARRKALAVRLEVADAVPPLVRTDALRLRQVLGNLLDNAVKFTDAGSVGLTVAVQEAGEGATVRLRFEVSDTGVGIPLGQQALLFQPFHQADSSVRRRFGGTGLGLAISRHLARALGGELGLRSAEGQGATFWLTLPVTVVAADPHAAGEEPVDGAVGRPLTILLVEDEPVSRRVGSEMLRALGHRVTPAASGEEALALFEGGGSFDCVLLDLHMPGVDGLETARRLRGREPGGERTRLLALTADASPEMVERSRQAGIDTVISKPVRMEALARRLARPGGEEAPVTAESPPVLDEQALTADLRQLGPAMVRQLIDLFFRHGTVLVADLEGAAQAGDTVAAATAAHRLAGSCASVALPLLSQVARRVHHAARGGRLEEMRGLVAELRAEWERSGERLAEAGTRLFQTTCGEKI